MVKAVKRILGTVALAAVAWLCWGYFFPNEEKRIRKTLDSVAKAACIAPNQTPVQMGLAVDKLLGYLTPDIEVDIEVPDEGRLTFSGRAEVRDAAFAAHRNLGEVKVEFFDVAVAIAPDKRSAVASLTVKATQAGTKDFLVQAVRLQLRKDEGSWRINRAQTERALRP
ncbi:MAG: hypothetical protein N2379_10845 [Verrucomicrobiae bacterium]|nr:hypothetical protein [Verrucomicrobiae bacterium]